MTLRRITGPRWIVRVGNGTRRMVMRSLSFSGVTTSKEVNVDGDNDKEDDREENDHDDERV